MIGKNEQARYAGQYFSVKLVQYVSAIIEKKCMFRPMKKVKLTMPIHRAQYRTLRDERKPVINRTVVVAAAAAVVVCCSLNGCAVQSGQKSSQLRSDLYSIVVSPSGNNQSSSLRDMPSWIELYREKKLVSVATVDHVVIVTFETHGDRDEVFYYYFNKFSEEESFSSFRNSRDIISFIRDGFGVKITLLDQSKQLWSLEYHRQMI
jgi:hypothetical protein